MPHLKNAEYPIASFGQGCEGEPLLQADLLEKAILDIRKKTSRGTINLNSNASLPEAIERLAVAGLNSLRVSLNSAQEIYYTRYYRPENYKFAAIFDSIRTMKATNKFVSLNYFILPGFTDSYKETAALIDLIEQTQPDYIQLRNLNMDPEWYFKTLDFPKNHECYGIREWLGIIRNHFPDLGFGYYNPPIDQ